MERPAEVAALPSGAAAALRAQAVISSPAEAVAELVANSLDAGAREVHVELDLAPGGLALAVRDDGEGIRAADLPLLGRCYATSKARGSATAVGNEASQVLGYRGEALACLCEAAAEVEVTSRAVGSFETHACLLRGGGMPQHGLALEQRKRQGTTVAVRGLFAAQPVRRKALAAAGLQREADRCKEAVLRLALLRGDVTFTVFDRGRRTFLLRMLRGREEADSVAQLLGLPADQIATVGPAYKASHAISGHAAVPPHGHSSASRQLIFLNGRWVKAPPIAKLADSLFQTLYKANMKLLQGQGEELRRVHSAANRHAAFALHIRCPPSEYELSHEPGGAVAHFRSWEPLLGCVRHALLAAWRLTLSNSLLRELENLDGAVVARGTADSRAAADQAAPGSGTRQPAQQMSTQAPQDSCFHEWLHGLQADGDAGLDLSLPQQRSRQLRLADGQQLQEHRDAEAAAGSGSGQKAASGGSGGSLRQRAGAKHSLASRLVRYSAAAAQPRALANTAAQLSGPGKAPPETGAAAAGRGQAMAWDGQYAMSPWPGYSTGLVQASTQGLQPSALWQQEQPQPPLEATAAGCGRCLVLASLLPQRELGKGFWEHDERHQQQEHRRQCRSPRQLEQPVLLPDQAAFGHGGQALPLQQRLGSEEEVNCLIDSWALASQRRQKQEQQQRQRWCEEEPPWGHLAAAESAGRAGLAIPSICQLRTSQEAPLTRQRQPQGSSLNSIAKLPSEDDPADSCSLLSDPAGAAALAAQQQQRSHSQHAERQTESCMQQARSGQLSPCPQQLARPSLGHTAAVTKEEQALLQSLLAAPQLPAAARPHSAPGYQQGCHRTAFTDERHAANLIAACKPSAAAVMQRQNNVVTLGGQRGAAVTKRTALDGSFTSQQPLQRPSHQASAAEGSGRMASPAASPADVTVPPPAPLPSFLQPDSGFLSSVQPSWRQPHRKPRVTAAAVAAAPPSVAVLPAAAATGRQGSGAVEHAQHDSQVEAAPPCSDSGAGAGQAAPQDQGSGKGVLAASGSTSAHLPSFAVTPEGAGPADAALRAESSSSSAILTLDALAAASFVQLAPGTLSREQLAAGRALRQVDRKYIPLQAGSLLALVDQHAADERVQLEQLRSELVGPDGQAGQIPSQALRTPLPLGLTDAEQQLLEAHRGKVEAWGWRWEPGAAGPLLSHAPLLWGTTLTATDLKLYLHLLHDTCGAGGMPSGVVRVLNSKACRGAIMFGDELDQEQCQALLGSLSATQLCFSCAHGRPTTAPVVDLSLLRRALQLRAAAQLPGAPGHDGGGSGDRGRVALSGLKAKLQQLVG